MLAGGLGLVGWHISQELVKKGAREVRILDNENFSEAHTVAALSALPSVRLHRRSVLDPAACAEAMKGVDGLFILAACMSRYTQEDPRRTLDLNLTGMDNLLSAAVHAGVKNAVFSSSTGVYGYAVSGSVTEEMPLGSKGVNSAAVIYGASKLIGEKLCEHYSSISELKVVSLRYSTVYGEHMHSRAANARYILGVIDQLNRSEAPEYFDGGIETKDFVYGGDVARANVMAIESDLDKESFNISGCRMIPVKEITAIIQREMGTGFEPVSKSSSNVVRLVSPDPFVYCCDKAKTMLGWEPHTSFEEGIKRVVNWRSSISALFDFDTPGKKRA
ncbi:NAD dependent epimerase/dehydratase [Phaeobacter inhibens]|uniref:NAD-dependent epimerase/dehydratase family protein n=1 Tax=Phaeobacter inhibens TaxID=221822 RepID=UPI0027796C99|nr:NAD-dependent epimerase/dehydratase family protein [Phaeobacter inhibens]GLO71891.1 NAD dependent epimerase/dehydratase [Phaeobacter inhibens]